MEQSAKTSYERIQQLLDSQEVCSEGELSK